MTYSNKIQWTDEKIIQKIKEMVATTKQTTFPTSSETNLFFGDFRLSNAMRRSSKSRHEFARMLGLDIKQCESSDGYSYELKCQEYLIAKLGMNAELTPIKHSYDVLVDRAVKIDVKHSNLQGEQKNYFSCNIEKKVQTCDIFVIYCTCEEEEKVYIIPSVFVSGMSQIALGVKHSPKYDKFLNRWDIIEKYSQFMQETE